MNRAHSPRTILHVDLDAFFAAVEQRDRPELRGKPVVVGGGGPNDRGVVSTASYEARVFGVRSAMPLRTAAALCPQAIFVPVDGRKYTEVSKQVMAILRRFTPLIEPLSIDEAFLDMTGTDALFGTGEEVGRKIQQAVRDELELTISVGVASNRLVAKIASDLRKPEGLVVVPPGEERAFLAPLAIERLWGVGARTRKALADYDVKTIGDLAALPEDVLVRRFGSHGASISARARGIGDTEVGEGETAAKSISHEHTFDVDTDDWEVIERTLLALSEGVGGRLRSSNVLCSTVAVKIRDTEFVTITRQRTLARSDRFDRRHLEGSGRPDSARGKGHAGAASRRRCDWPDRRNADGPLRRGRRQAAESSGGRGRGSEEIRVAVDRTGEAASCGCCGALRARSVSRARPRQGVTRYLSLRAPMLPSYPSSEGY